MLIPKPHLQRQRLATRLHLRRPRQVAPPIALTRCQVRLEVFLHHNAELAIRLHDHILGMGLPVVQRRSAPVSLRS